MSTLAAIQLREAMSALTCATSILESTRERLLREIPQAARHISIAITEAEAARLRAAEAIRVLQLQAAPEFANRANPHGHPPATPFAQGEADNPDREASE